VFPPQTKNLRRLYWIRTILYVAMTVIGLVVIGVHAWTHR